MPEYTQEQFWKLYEKLPQELKDVIFSEETANNIGDVCERNNIEDEKISEVTLYAGRVLLGILPPDEFQKTLEKEMKLKKEIAKKVAQEINRFIFFPVKESLAMLYKIEIAPSTGPPTKPPTGPPPTKPLEAAPLEEKSERSDVYREPIE